MSTNYKIFLLYVIAFVALTSCSRIDEMQGKDSEIAFVADVTGTKGCVNTTDNLNVSPNALVCDAFLEADGRSAKDDAKPHYIASNIFNYDTGSWVSSNSFWRNDVYTNFWCRYPKSTNGSLDLRFPTNEVAATSDEAQKSITLTYTTPVDAASMDDLIFAYARKKFSGSSPTVKVQFCHALSAIQFKAGTISSEYGIKSISLSGFNKKGICSVTGKPSSEGDNSNDLAEFSWSSLSEPGTFTAALELTAGITSETMLTGTEKLFMVIPQTVGKLKVTIVFTKDGTSDITSEMELSDEAFSSGKLYTYKVSFNGIKSQISLDDETNWYDQGSGTYDTYAFSVDKTTLTFVNTIDVSPVQIVNVTSTKTVGEGTAENASWKIKSYAIGAAQTIVDGDSFTANGITATIDATNSVLNVSADAREQEIDMGSHDYWTGGNEDWSPEDWSTTRATESDPLDLSKLDFQTEEDITEESKMNTANCYIIRHSGTYKIPLVYGNGIVDDTGNPDSYTFSAGDYILEHFVNHLNADITSPYIEDNAGCHANDATIVWQDNGHIVTDLEIIGTYQGTDNTTSTVRYLKFTVGPDVVRENNAVIAVRDDSGNIMWSWHIWITNNPVVLEEPVSTGFDFMAATSIGGLCGITYAAKNALTIDVCPAEDESVTKQIKVLQPIVHLPVFTLYQWGRKDPLPCNDVLAEGSFTSTSGQGSTSEAIQSPAVMWKTGDYDSSWNTDPKINFWGFTSGTSSVKTIYDPSPVGYRVPEKDAYYSLTTADETDREWTGTGLSYSQYYSNIVFPALGYRSSSSGSYKLGSVQGEYWTSYCVWASSKFISTSFFFTSQQVEYSDNNPQAYGFAVRPVKEDEDLF